MYHLFKEINSSYIDLIPKIENLEAGGPIVQCIIFCKIISNILMDKQKRPGLFKEHWFQKVNQ